MASERSRTSGGLRAQEAALKSVTGVHLMQGVGHRPAQGFWTEAWGQVVRRPGAIFGLAWLAVVVFFAVFAPVLASGHPLVLWKLDEEGNVAKWSSPLWDQLTGGDVLMMLGVLVGGVLLLPRLSFWPRQSRLGALCVCAVASGLTVACTTGVLSVAAGVSERFDQRAEEVSSPAAGAEGAGMAEVEPAPAEPEDAEAGGAGRSVDWFRYATASGVALVIFGAALWVPFFEGVHWRLIALAPVAIVSVAAIGVTGEPPLETFEYRKWEARGEARAAYTLVPFSPAQGSTSLDLRPPRATPMNAVIDGLLADAARAQGVGGFADDTRWQVRRRAEAPSTASVPFDEGLRGRLERQLAFNAGQLPRPAGAIMASIDAAAEEGRIASLRDVVEALESESSAVFLLGTDSNGRDVLTQMLHACRLSISIGLVSTGIAVFIGVTMGALMGYFGGWVDMVLYRVVEIFMAVPVLFLLIVAAGVLPRNTYVMMIIIGCVTWTGAARFIRAEFYKLRDQDFVQSARAVGLPLRSILFKHMLPNGVTPVLVESSFAIAAAILAEATLSYLGLGPANQASWGRLLSDATNQVGDFVWWLAIYPGAAIFLTVLSYNLIGEALRDAIDPKLKKARV